MEIDRAIAMSDLVSLGFARRRSRMEALISAGFTLLGFLMVLLAVFLAVFLAVSGTSSPLSKGITTLMKCSEKTYAPSP